MNAELTGITAPPSLSGLSFLWLEITAKCNLECLHCYADSSPRVDLQGQMKTQDWLTVIRESADLGCRQVQFIGGEPTLHPDLAGMIEFAYACGYTFIEVFTNATILTEKLLQTFLKFNVHVATSFYSDDSEVHDLITKHPGSFDRTVAVMKKLVDVGVPVRAGIIEMEENQGHARQARRFLEALGIHDIKIDFQRGVGRGAHVYSLEPMSQLCGECWKGKLCITSSGRTYPCVFSRFADMGTVDRGISNIVSDDALLDFRAVLREYRRKKELELMVGDCGPDTRCRPTCSPCGPAEFSEPCGPCEPASRPCQPAYSCAPDTQCVPDVRCGPNSDPWRPER